MFTGSAIQRLRLLTSPNRRAKPLAKCFDSTPRPSFSKLNICHFVSPVQREEELRKEEEKKKAAEERQRYEEERMELERIEQENREKRYREREQEIEEHR